MNDLVTAAERNMVCIYEKGSKAVETRLKNAIQELKVMAPDIRKEVTEKKNNQ